MTNYNDINVVQLVYNRPEYLDEQLRRMSVQTVSFTYHIIVNNPSLYETFDAIIHKYDDVLDLVISYTDNSKRAFHRHEYIRDRLLDNKHIIIIDDDELLAPTQVEELWNNREEQVFSTWFGRQFKGSNKFLTANPWCRNGTRPDITEFSYGGTGFCVVDTDIFSLDGDFFMMERRFPYFCHTMDDIVLSWACNKSGWRIKRNMCKPEIFIEDNKSLFNEIGQRTQEFVDLLDNIYKFRRF